MRSGCSYGEVSPTSLWPCHDSSPLQIRRGSVPAHIFLVIVNSSPYQSHHPADGGIRRVKCKPGPFPLAKTTQVSAVHRLCSSQHHPLDRQHLHHFADSPLPFHPLRHEYPLHPRQRCRHKYLEHEPILPLCLMRRHVP